MSRYMHGILWTGFVLLLVGCAGMTSTEQRMLSGGAMGAAAGAGIGAATGGDPGVGAAIGGAAGALGGAAVDQMDRSRRSYDTDRGYYDRGYGGGYYEERRNSDHRYYNDRDDYDNPGYQRRHDYNYEEYRERSY